MTLWSSDDFVAFFASGGRRAPGVDPGRTRALFDRYKARPLPKILHVAGTNGKGSCCAFAEQLIRASGKRVGLFTSPHLESVRERIQVNRELIPEERFASLMGAFSELRETHSFSELLLATAIEFFLETEVEYAVLETGLGGRLDPTNYLPSAVSAVTNIGTDHVEILGHDPKKRALEKAAIAKPAQRFFCTERNPDLSEVICEFVTSRGAEFVQVEELGSELLLGLKGEHQRLNASLAAAIVQDVLGDLQKDFLSSELKEAFWPGRLERFELPQGKEVYLDCAHNIEAFEALSLHFAGKAQPALILAASTNGRLEEGLTVFRSSFEEILLVENDFRSADLRLYESNHSLRVVGSPEQALSEALQSRSTVLVTGSVYLVGRLRKHLLSLRSA